MVYNGEDNQRCARATKTKNKKQENKYKKTYTDKTSGDRHTKRIDD
jgi:hypothetical protein